jgi:radical SAM superfamily enzyme YgiQ (UPF0313 family)
MMSNDVEWVVDAAKQIKAIAPMLPVVVGGPHTTFFPDFLNAHPEIDACCVGEGDEAIIDIASAVTNKTDFASIPNMVARTPAGAIVHNSLRPLIQDLDSLPFADRQIYRKYNYFHDAAVTSLIATRGCPYDCNFCFNHQYKQLYNTAKFRLRSAENIIAEIKAIQAQGIKINMLFFVDSTINLNASWCEDLFRRYKQHVDIKFSVNLAAGQITERVLRAMAETGNCHSVRFAVEVGNEWLRKKVLRKPLNDKDIKEAANLLREYNIPIYVFLMFGVPHETEETAKETIRFCQQLRPGFVKPALFVPYRELDITTIALEQGFLKSEDLKRLDDPRFSSLDSVMRLNDINAIKNLFYFSVLMIHFPRLGRWLMKLIHLRGNPLFRMVYVFSFILQNFLFFGIPWRRGLLEFKHHKIET